MVCPEHLQDKLILSFHFATGRRLFSVSYGSLIATIEWVLISLLEFRQVFLFFSIQPECTFGLS